MGLFDRNKFPELTSHLNKGERVLAWAEHSGGNLYVTTQALLSLDHHENLRIPWELSLHAKWEEPLLTLASQPDASSSPVTRAWQVPIPGSVPDAVRERITTAQVFDQVRDLPGIGKVRFIARKGADGVNWTTLSDAVIDQDSQAHIQAQLAELKKTLGI